MNILSFKTQSINPDSLEYANITQQTKDIYPALTDEQRKKYSALYF